MPSIWDDFARGYDAGTSLGDKVVRRSSSKKARKLESDLEARGLSPEEYYDELEKGLAEIGARAERRGLDISDVIQGIKTRRQGSVERQEGRDTIAAEGLAGAPPVAPESGPLGAAPIAPVGGGRGLAAASGIAPQEASPMGVPAMPPPTASPMARASGVNAPGYEGIHSRGSRELLARGDIKGGLSRADQARAARTGEEALAAPRTITGELDLAPGFRADEEALTRRGDREGAQAAGAKNTTFRHNLALNNLGTLMRDIEMGEMDPDRLAGVSKNAFQNLPETGIDHLQMSEDGSTIDFIYADGREPNSLPNTPEGRAQMVSAFGAYSKDPQTYMNESMAARAKQIADDKEEQRGIDKEERTALVAGITEHFIKNPPKAYETALTAALKSDGKAGQNSDFKNLQLGPGKSSIVVNGTPVTVEIAGENTVWPEHMPVEDRIPGRMIVQMEDGQTTDFKTLGLSEKGASSVTSILTQAATYDAANKDANFQGFLTAINGVFGTGGGGKAGSPGKRRGPGEGGGDGNNRADRNNNPGNIRDVGQFKDTPGYKGKDDDGFAIFDSPEAGVKAHESQLKRYMSGDTTGEPLTTVNDIVKTWSPSGGEGNTPESTDNYILAVAEALGVDPDDKLSPKDIPRLAAAMSTFEGFTGGSAASKPSAPSAPSAPSPASPSPIAKKTPAQLDAEKKAADAAKVTAAEREQAALGTRPKERSRIMSAVEDAKTGYKEADSTLQEFDADMRKQYGTETSTGMTKLNADQKAFRQRLVAARDRAEEIVDDTGRDLKRAESNIGQAERKKTSAAATASLEEKYGNPDTDYIKSGAAKSRSAK